MPRRYSNAFGVTPEALKKEGAFNGFVDIDARFHIDPHFLASSSAPELATSYQTFQTYLEDVIHLLVASRSVGDFMFRRAQNRLRFGELPYVSLGYGRGVLSPGSGIGPWFATKMATAGFEIVNAGVTNPRIFELVGLLEDEIGADRISDMTASIVAGDLLAFSARVARNLAIPTTTAHYGDQLYAIPYDPVTRRPVLLVSEDILRTLPVAESWEAIDRVHIYNESLRSVVNAMIGETWKDATTRLTKHQLKQDVLAHPALLEAFLSQYAVKPAIAYSFEKDPDGILAWHELAEELAQGFPLSLPTAGRVTPQRLGEIARTICRQFGRLLERFGLRELQYSDKGNLRR